MAFKVHCDAVDIHQRLLGSYAGRIYPGFRHMIAKRAACIEASGSIHLTGADLAEESPAANMLGTEPGVLLPSKRQNRNIAPRKPGISNQRLDHSQPCQDTGETVEIAATGNRVQMRPDNHARQIALPTRPYHPGVERGIDMHFEAHAPCLPQNDIVGSLLAFPERIARDPIAITAGFPDLIEETGSAIDRTAKGTTRRQRAVIGCFFS
jgi:hypothetical protein